MASLPKLELARLVGDSTWRARVDGGAWSSYVTAANYYYWESNGPDAGSALRAQLQTAVAALVASSTVVINDTTGKMTITFGSGTHTLEFSTSDMASWCGFDNVLQSPGAGSFTSNRQVKGLWLPNIPASGLLAPVGAVGPRRTDKRMRIARSGKPWITQFNSRRDNHFRFYGLTKAKTWAAFESSGQANESAEQFWADGLSGANSRGAFRFYTDRTNDSSYLAGSDEMDFYSVDADFEPKRLKSNYDPAWSWEFDVVEYV